jgi:hypothetical protein
MHMNDDASNNNKVRGCQWTGETSNTRGPILAEIFSRVWICNTYASTDVSSGSCGLVVPTPKCRTFVHSVRFNVYHIRVASVASAA